MIQISNGAGRLATVDRVTDGRVTLELEDTDPYTPGPTTPGTDRAVVIGMYLEHTQAALLAIAILNANIGGDAWRNLQHTYPRVMVPEDFDTRPPLQFPGIRR